MGFFMEKTLLFIQLHRPVRETFVYERYFIGFSIQQTIARDKAAWIKTNKLRLSVQSGGCMSSVEAYVLFVFAAGLVDEGAKRIITYRIIYRKILW
jgi:hypothetical protein